MTHLPYFLPDDYTGRPESPTTVPGTTGLTWRRPAGWSGSRGSRTSSTPSETIAPIIDLRIAGSGPFEGELRRLADRARERPFRGVGSTRPRSPRCSVAPWPWPCRRSFTRRSATSSSRRSPRRPPSIVRDLGRPARTRRRERRRPDLQHARRTGRRPPATLDRFRPPGQAGLRWLLRQARASGRKPSTSSGISP